MEYNLIKKAISLLYVNKMGQKTFCRYCGLKITPEHPN